MAFEGPHMGNKVRHNVYQGLAVHAGSALRLLVEDQFGKWVSNFKPEALTKSAVHGSAQR